MPTNSSLLSRFFGVVIKGQTYLNLLYLLLAFPLGLIYFIFLVTGLSLGIALTIIWIGLLVLALVFAGWWLMAALERQLAIWLLHEKINPMVRKDLAGANLWTRINEYVTNPVTWKGLLYLFVKFPLGILSFVALTTLGTLSAVLLFAPVIVPFFPYRVDFGGNAVWYVSTIPQALLLAVVGLFLTFISMHALNGLAWVSGRFARIMLGNQPRKTINPELELSAPVAGHN
jgi:hypothetical protein